MENKIFRITYEDDRGHIRMKWIIVDHKDAFLLWYKNPLRELKLESVKLGQIQRTEERNFVEMWDYICQKQANSDELQDKILEITGDSPTDIVLMKEMMK